MVAADEARALALALPGAEANSHFDTPDFRVNGKIFATLPGPDRMIVRMLADDQSTVVAAEPATFAPCPGTWGEKGWTIVQLGSVAPDVLRDLLTGSWRLLMPRPGSGGGRSGVDRAGSGVGGAIPTPTRTGDAPAR